MDLSPGLSPETADALVRLTRLRPQLQEDLADVVIGSLLLAVGLAVCGLATFRDRGAARLLLCLGISNGLYGLRLLIDTDILGYLAGIPTLPADYLNAVITYVLPLGLILFVEWTLGPGWHSTVRWARYLQTAYAVGAILTDAVRGPEAAMGLNNLVVLVVISLLLLNGAIYLRRNPGILRRAARTRDGRGVIAAAAVSLLLVLNENMVEAGLLPWSFTAESFGFLLMLLALAYAFVHRIFANERQLAAVSQELETARRIQASILPRQMPGSQKVALAARYLPMTSVGGDFYDFLVVDQDRMGILIADVSGHGVPAALIASMVKVALAAQTGHAEDPAAVLAGMNQVLCGNLERAFVTAAYVFLNTDTGRAVYASAGHPPLLVWRHAEGRAEEMRQESLPLGRFRRAAYQGRELDVAPGDRLLLYTDGILEAPNPAGEPFGEERLRDALGSSGGPDDLADALLASLSRWSGRRPGEPLDDDVTLVAAEIRRDSAPGEFYR